MEWFGHFAFAQFSNKPARALPRPSWVAASALASLDWRGTELVPKLDPTLRTVHVPPKGGVHFWTSIVAVAWRD
jgi:hypothetical protein